MIPSASCFILKEESKQIEIDSDWSGLENASHATCPYLLVVFILKPIPIDGRDPSSALPEDPAENTRNLRTLVASPSGSSAETPEVFGCNWDQIRPELKDNPANDFVQDFKVQVDEGLGNRFTAGPGNLLYGRTEATFPVRWKSRSS